MGQVGEVIKVAVVDAVLVFVEERIDFRWTSYGHIPQFEHASVTVSSGGASPPARRTQKAIHRIADNPRLQTPLPAELAPASDASERGNRFDVRPRGAVLKRIFAHPIRHRIKRAIHPAWMLGRGGKRAKNRITIVVRVHLPAKSELVQIAHAVNALSFQLRPV